MNKSILIHIPSSVILPNGKITRFSRLADNRKKVKGLFSIFIFTIQDTTAPARGLATPP
jgi:hypothetical protein